jgi:hypothetical protein
MAAEAASLATRNIRYAAFIKSEYRMSNKEFRKSKEAILSILIKRLSQAKPHLEIRRLSILRFCGPLFDHADSNTSG